MGSFFSFYVKHWLLMWDFPSQKYIMTMICFRSLIVRLRGRLCVFLPRLMWCCLNLYHSHNSITHNFIMNVQNGYFSFHISGKENIFVLSSFFTSWKNTDFVMRKIYYSEKLYSSKLLTLFNLSNTLYGNQRYLLQTSPCM